MTGAQYASLTDVQNIFRSLTQEESDRAAELIPIICASLREEARKRGRDLDDMIALDPDLEEVAKSVVVDVVGRTLNTSTSSEPMTQATQSALGYSVTGTFLVPGGGLFIKNSELKRLGLLRQRIGVMEIYDVPD